MIRGKELKRVTCATLFVSSLVAQGCSTVQDAEQPNILIILLDDAGYNDFGFMGCPDIETPNIDALAADGVILTDGHTSATVSGPSRCGLLTGRYQQRGGYECNLESILGMDLQESTIADIFRDNGYKTIGIGKWHQGNGEEYHPNNRGFDEFYGFISGSRSYFYNTNRHDSPSRPISNLQHNGKSVAFDQYLTYELGDVAIDYFKQSKEQEQPFMMYLSYNAVHGPFEATEEDLSLFEGHPRQMLAAMTYAVDKSIGDVVAALRESGQYDNTLIFFLSDNGGVPDNQVNNAPLKGWKGNKFEGGHRVPYFITYGDKIAKGTKYDGLCSSLDILSTSIAAAGIEYTNSERPLDGVDLLPYLKGEKSGDAHETLFWRKKAQRAVRQGSFKFIEVDGVGDILYSLEHNLSEDCDISKIYPQKRVELQQLLHAWESELVNPVLWDEKTWEPVNVEIHRALMNNESNVVMNPTQYRERLNTIK